MLIVEDSNQKQYIAGIFDKNTLKKLTAQKELLCPCCKEPVIYAAGDVNVHHFRHSKHSTCINTISETEEHRKKKLLIYQWLISKQYPFVRLEYWLPDTQQRADVYVETSEGDKYVMEIQCSPISYSQWLERHLKYQSLGIKDIWFFGCSFINPDYQRGFFSPSQSKYLFEKINKRNKFIYFLLDNGELVTTGSLMNEAMNWKPDSRYNAPLYATLKHRLEDMVLKQNSKTFLWPDTPDLLDTYNQYHQQVTNNRKEKLTSLLEKREMRKKRKEKMQNNEISYTRPLRKKRGTKAAPLAVNRKETYVVNAEERENYRSFLKIFSITNIQDQMTENEKLIFEQLILKYNINNGSFPPLCLVELTLNSAIKTPYCLWQLMILDMLTQTKFNSYVSLASIQKAILNFVRVTDLRQASKLIHEYLLTLRKVSLLTGGSLEALYLPFRNRIKQFPKSLSRRNTILVAYGLSKYKKGETDHVLQAVQNELLAYRLKLN